MLVFVIVVVVGGGGGELVSGGISYWSLVMVPLSRVHCKARSAC